MPFLSSPPRFMSRTGPVITCVAAAFLFALLLSSCSVSAPVEEGEGLYGDYLSARHAEQRGDMETARERLAGVAASREDENMSRHLFFLHLTSGNYADAWQLAASLARTQSANDTAHMFLGAFAFKEGMRQQALHAFSDLEVESARDWIGPIASAWILWEEGEREAARERLDALPDNAPLSGFARFHAAALADLSGDRDAADEFYRRSLAGLERFRVLEILPRFTEGYGNFLERHGRGDEAAELYRRQGERGTTTPQLWRRLRASALREEVPPPLIADGTAGISALFHDIGLLLFRQGEGQHAIAYLRLSLLLGEDARSRLVLGETYEQMGFAESALKNYRAIPSTSPDALEAGLHIADIFEEQGQEEEALAQLRALWEAHPDSRLASLALAEFLRNQERYAEAIDFYGDLIASLHTPDDEDWALFFGRAIAYERSGAWELAEADLQDALRLSGEHPLVLNYLAYVWADRGERLQQALEMLRKAGEARPNNGFIIDSLGWVYYRLGDFDKATEYLERAVTLEPRDPIINDHLGDSLWRSGRKLEARFQWRRALGLEPEAKEIAAIEEKLLRGLPPLSSASP